MALLTYLQNLCIFSGAMHCAGRNQHMVVFFTGILFIYLSASNIVYDLQRSKVDNIFSLSTFLFKANIHSYPQQHQVYNSFRPEYRSYLKVLRIWIAFGGLAEINFRPQRYQHIESNRKFDTKDFINSFTQSSCGKSLTKFIVGKTSEFLPRQA